jgi:hypothetical protein
MLGEADECSKGCSKGCSALPGWLLNAAEAQQTLMQPNRPQGHAYLFLCLLCCWTPAGTAAAQPAAGSSGSPQQQRSRPRRICQRNSSEARHTSPWRCCNC